MNVAEGELVRVSGFIDLFADDLHVVGWAWDPAAPERRVEVEFLVGDEPAGTTTAELYRKDVAEAGIGDGRYGFAWRLPFAALAKPGETVIAVRDKASGEELPNRLRLPPEDLAVLLAGAAAQEARAQPEVAVAALRAAVRLEPENPWRRLELAELLRGQGLLDEAEAELTEILRRQPGFWHAHVALGHAARVRADHEAALGFFEQAAARAPEDVWRWLDVAEEQRALGRLDEAAETLARLQGLAPEHWAVHVALGQCARARGDRIAARGHFEDAARFAPDEPAPRLYLAEELRDAGELDAARDAVLALLPQYPGHLLLLLNLAYTERQAGQHEAAAQWFGRALEVEPRNATLLAELAREEYLLGQQEDSNRHLAHALELDPAHAGAVAELARQALAVGDAAQAYEIYRLAAESRPSVLEFRFGMFDALAWQGRSAEALAGLDALEAAHGATPGLYSWRITLLRRIGRYGEALRVARAATVAEPGQFWLWVERFNTEMLAGTDAALQKCLFGIPAATGREKAVKRRCIGALAESLWLTGAAMAHYEAAGQLDPEDISTQEALARICLLRLDLAGACRHLRRQYELMASDRRLRGESLNISQSLLGQLIEEYALDQALAGALAGLQTLAPGPRAEKLRALVLENPASTAAAASLLLALRQAEALDYVPPPPGTAVIPRIITAFWDTKEIPADVGELIGSWQALNPRHKPRVFDAGAAADYLAARFTPDVAIAYRRVREVEQKADIFRLAVLVAEGGVYADADDRCLKPLDTFLPAGAGLVLAQDGFGCAANNFIAATPGHPVLAAALQSVVEAVNRGDNEIPWLLSGPGALTRALARYLAGSAGGRLPAGLALLDRRELTRAVAANCFAAYKTYKMKHRKRIDAAALHMSAAPSGPVADQAGSAATGSAAAFTPMT